MYTDFLLVFDKKKCVCLRILTRPTMIIENDNAVKSTDMILFYNKKILKKTVNERN